MSGKGSVTGGVPGGAGALGLGAENFDEYLDRPIAPIGGLETVHKRRHSTSSNGSNSGVVADANGQEGESDLALSKRAAQLRESWRSVPFTVRMMSVAMIVFAIVAAMFAAMIQDEMTVSYVERGQQPQLLSLISDVLGSVSREAQLATAFIAKDQEINALFQSSSDSSSSGAHSVLSGLSADLSALQDQTNAAIQRTLTFYKEHQQDLYLPVLDRSDATLSSEMQLGNLYEVRRRVAPVPLLSADAANKVYSTILTRMATFYFKVASILNSPFALNEPLLAASMAVAGTHYLERAAAATTFLETTSPSTRRDSFVDMVKAEGALDALTNLILQPMLSVSDWQLFSRDYWSASAPATAFGRMSQLWDSWVSTSPASSWTVTGAALQTGVINASATAAGRFLREVEAFDTTIVGVPKAEEKQLAAPILLALTGVLVIVCGSFTVINRMTDSTYSAELRAAHVMREAIVRVSEFTHSFESFDLNPPPPPEGMMGTPTGEMELRLQHCLASLRCLATTIPAILLPHRSQDAFKAVEHVRMIEKGFATIQRTERHFVNSSSLQVLSLKDTVDRPSFRVMEGLTKVQVKEVYVHCLTLDLAHIHRSMNAQKGVLENTALMYPRILEQFEEAILHFGGILCSVWMDHAVAVWQGTGPSTETAITVAHAATTVVSRLNHLRKLSGDKLSQFHVHVALTAGTVLTGVFGNDEYKTVQYFGVPIAQGQVYAQVNEFHSTAIVCDEEVKEAIQGTFPCKPIELLPSFELFSGGSWNGSNGDEHIGNREGSASGSRHRLQAAHHSTQSIAYEVIAGQARKEDDLQTRLATYKRAFDLFSQRYYREALKAFRFYTKQYGYDRSVERIQAVMTGE